MVTRKISKGSYFMTQSSMEKRITAVNRGNSANIFRNIIETSSLDTTIAAAIGLRIKGKGYRKPWYWQVGIGQSKVKCSSSLADTGSTLRGANLKKAE